MAAEAFRSPVSPPPLQKAVEPPDGSLPQSDGDSEDPSYQSRCTICDEVFVYGWMAPLTGVPAVFTKNPDNGIQDDDGTFVHQSCKEKRDG